MHERNHDISNRDVNDLLDKQFLGVVMLIDDPRKEGRARVKVQTIHDDIPSKDIPWAYPKNKSVYFGQDGKAGSISIPKIGSIVAVRFDNGNPYSPEYFAIHELADDIKDELDTEYEGSHFILFDGDQELKIWFSVSKGLTLSVKGALINIAPDKLITLETTNKVIVDSPKIELSKGALESVIKGDTFIGLFNSHTHGSPSGPTTPPTIPIQPASILSKITKTN
jgi:hypothetical protein